MSIIRNQLRVGLVLLITAVILVGCKSVEVSERSEERVVVKKQGGPPPHAPAHGYRAKHVYRYYPDTEIYFDTKAGGYWYARNGQWEFGAKLPSSMDVSFGDYVTIEMDTDKPYTEHENHKKDYPPGQAKDKSPKGKAKSKKNK